MLACESIEVLEVESPACQFYSRLELQCWCEGLEQSTREGSSRDVPASDHPGTDCSKHVAVHKHVSAIEKQLSDDNTCIQMQQLKRLASDVLRSPLFCAQPCFRHCGRR